MQKRKLEKKLARKTGIVGDRQGREDKGENLPIGRGKEQERRKVICLCLGSAAKAMHTNRKPLGNANPHSLSSWSDITTWSGKLQAKNSYKIWSLAKTRAFQNSGPKDCHGNNKPHLKDVVTVKITKHKKLLQHLQD